MRDRYWYAPDGALIAVSDMLTRDIFRILASHRIRPEGDASVSTIRNRLEIELTIRALDLRGAAA